MNRDEQLQYWKCVNVKCQLKSIVGNWSQLATVFINGSESYSPQSAQKRVERAFRMIYSKKKKSDFRSLTNEWCVWCLTAYRSTRKVESFTKNADRINRNYNFSNALIFFLDSWIQFLSLSPSSSFIVAQSEMAFNFERTAHLESFTVSFFSPRNENEIEVMSGRLALDH